MGPQPVALEQVGVEASKIDRLVYEAVRDVDQSLLDWALSCRPASGFAPAPMPRLLWGSTGLAHPPQADLDALIVALTEAGVELIVVGGAAAVLHGAPVTTVDLDVVHRRTPENVERLLAVLTTLETTYRAPAKPGLRVAHPAGAARPQAVEQRHHP